MEDCERERYLEVKSSFLKEMERELEENPNSDHSQVWVDLFEALTCDMVKPYYILKLGNFFGTRNMLLEPNEYIGSELLRIMSFFLNLADIHNSVNHIYAQLVFHDQVDRPVSQAMTISKGTRRVICLGCDAVDIMKDEWWKKTFRRRWEEKQEGEKVDRMGWQAIGG